MNEVYILKTAAGQWAWELHVDGEIHQGGAGYESQGDAIEGVYESVDERFQPINFVMTREE